MKIWISTNALQGPDETLLWSGALYGLKRLQNSGHEVNFDSHKLSDRQQQLLENDDIIPSDFARKEAHLTVNTNDQTLLQAVGKDDIKIEEAKNWTKLS